MGLLDQRRGPPGVHRPLGRVELEADQRPLRRGAVARAHGERQQAAAALDHQPRLRGREAAIHLLAGTPMRRQLVAQRVR